MKKLLILFILVTANYIAKSQDVIIRNDKTEIKSKVTEITDTDVKYKKIERLDGPTYTIKKVDIFMIIYKDGTKEYMDNTNIQVSSTVQNNTNNQYSASLIQNNNLSNNIATSKNDRINDSIELQNIDRYTFSMGVDAGFSTFDEELFFRINKGFYFGISLYEGTDFSFKSGGFYPYLAYKQPLNPQKTFYLWANAGYNYSYFQTTDINGLPVSESSGDFLWELGADYYFSKNIGVTVYSPQLSSFFIGIVFRGNKFKIF